MCFLAKFCSDCQTVAELSVFKMDAVHHFVKKFKIVIAGTVQRVNVPIRQSVHHIGCVTGILGPPTKSNWWSLSLC